MRLSLNRQRLLTIKLTHLQSIKDANVTESFHEAYEFCFDIDTPTDIVQAHMRDQSGVIPKETFGQLSPESRKAWSQLSDDIQVDIL
jgi:hypothetical protein